MCRHALVRLRDPAGAPCCCSLRCGIRRLRQHQRVALGLHQYPGRRPDGGRGRAGRCLAVRQGQSRSAGPFRRRGKHRVHRPARGGDGGILQVGHGGSRQRKNRLRCRRVASRTQTSRTGRDAPVQSRPPTWRFRAHPQLAGPGGSPGGQDQRRPRRQPPGHYPAAGCPAKLPKQTGNPGANFKNGPGS